MRFPAVVVALALGALGPLGPLGSLGTVARADPGPSRVGETYAVGVRTDVVVDPSRPTPEIVPLGIAAASGRRLPITVFYPARDGVTATPVPDARPARGRFPVIVWAHGNGSSGSATPRQVSSWAKLGYVVVAPDFPVSSHARSNLDAIADWEHQPGDVSFVLDETLDDHGVAGRPTRASTRWSASRASR